tara:strand:+ start:173 stop:511 length:339 start_codon:yes stop_codon:yes gene_type:complete
MLTNADIKRIKKIEEDPDKRIKELEDKCRTAGRAMIELNLEWESTLAENKKLKKRAEEAEGEVTIVKGIGQNSPEMKALKEEVEKLKADLAREKEDRQYDNMVHEKELNDRR